MSAPQLSCYQLLRFFSLLPVLGQADSSGSKFLLGYYLVLLLLLLLSYFSRVRLCATPETAAHQAPPSLGFSRQEHWSGLPFPPPMHESEKWKWSHSVVSDSQWPHGLQPTRLLRPWDFPGKSIGVGCHCLLLTQCYFSSIDEPVKLPAKLCSSTENGIPISKRHPFFQQFMPGTNWVPCWSQWIS